ncbi:hypothetical protein EDE04_2669 [Streptomyces sp. 2132.2]|uniref:hypothetical protein n=1 Tax=Streptomyces sp. 2132.2 TaxID=2485161 RepID=UPI000F45F0DF|nr:hypothetical protein [Streptomyces sp. 2132.2]ROQ96210.1 hypothetical protein EDE04_2669 [Streptomyces sp. 2132.2]
MGIRKEVQDLLDAGPFPSEEAPVEEITETERLLEQIPEPVTDEEAQALTTVFGSDDCFGLSMTLLHVIETAPSAQTADYPLNTDNMWVELLNRRVAFARKLAEEEHRSSSS